MAAAALWYAFPQLMAWPLLLGLVPWLLRLAHEGRWRWRTPFDWPLLLFLASGLVSVWSAYDREIAWAKFWTIVAGLLLFYALAAFSLPKAPADPVRGSIATAWFLAFFGAGVSLYFLATHDWDAFPTKYAALSAIGRALQGPLPALPGHRLHPNVTGGILAMMVPFSAAVSWQAARKRNWPALILGVALLGLTLFGLLLSVSRGAWLALFGAVLLAVVWWLAGLGRKQPGRRRLVFSGMILLGAVAIVAGLLLWPDVPRRLLASLPLLAGGTSRLDLFRNSLVLVQEYPFIGAGLGGYMMLYSTYAFLTHVGFIIHAHNIYLDVLIEQGFVAFLALLWMWAIFAVALWREAYDGRIRPYLGAAALSLVTILLHGLVEDALYGSRSLMLLFLPLAFALPYPLRRVVGEAARSRWLVQGLGLGLLIAALVIWARPLQSAAISNITAVRQSQAELSRYQWPEWPIQDALRREIDLSAVLNGYQKALALNPNNIAANRRLGQLELSLGQYEEALKHLEMAYKGTPWDNGTRQLLGEALLVNGRVDEGAALWAQCQQFSRTSCNACFLV